MAELEISNLPVVGISRFLAKCWTANMKMYLSSAAEPHWKVLNIHQAHPPSSLESGPVAELGY